MRSVLCAVVLAAGACAAHAAGGQVVCPGNPGLADLAGIWVRPAFLQALQRTRSWQSALEQVDASTVTAYVRRDQVYFNRAWHEGDSGGHCVRTDGAQLWVRPADAPATWLGPYVRTAAKGTGDEAKVYLDAFFHGCFASDTHERWCLSPESITAGKQQWAASLQMDLSEGPNYGTAFSIGSAERPFVVFVPLPDGWAVYRDNWASADGWTDPRAGKPWQRLRTVR